MTINDVRNAIQEMYNKLNIINTAKYDYREFYGTCVKLLEIDSHLVSMEELKQIPDPKKLEETYQEVKKITNVFISTDKDGC